MVMEYEPNNVTDPPVFPETPVNPEDQNAVNDDNYTDTDIQSVQDYFQQSGDEDASNQIDAFNASTRDEYGDDQSEEDRVAATQQAIEADIKNNPDAPVTPTSVPTQTTKTVNSPKTPAAATAGASAGKAVTTNPLTEFSSSTYQITLYILTPESANELMSTGLKTFGSDPSKVRIIAQSGGVGPNPKPDVFEKSTPFKNLEVFIDDLRFKNLVGIQSGPTNPSGMEMEFTIYEPFGISFPARLRLAHKEMQSLTKMPGTAANRNALNWFYALGIRFFGYDKDGKLLKGTDIPGRRDYSKLDEFAHFERIFTIGINGLEFKLDGKTTAYKIKAANIPFTVGMDVEYGNVGTAGEISSDTVKGAIDQLKNHLNAEQEKSQKPRDNGEAARIKFKIEYDVKFHDIPNEDLVNSKLKADFWKQKNFEGQRTANTKVESSQNETEKPPPVQSNTRSLAYASGVPIPQIIESILINSELAQKYAVQKATTEKDAKTEYQEPPPLKWFTIIPKVESTAFDKARVDHTYKITYNVIAYKVSNVRSNQARPNGYPGAFKRYEYWYTGQNAEIISFEQVYDKLYVLLAEPNSDNFIDGPIDKRSHHTGSESISGTPLYSRGVDGIVSDLYMTGDNVQLNMTITGDPDYITHCNSSGMDVNLAGTNGKAYDGHSLNPNATQIFIEVKFNQADDYSTENGLLNANDGIRFWSYPGDCNPDAIIYQLASVTSTFSKGKFTQRLEGFLAAKLGEPSGPTTGKSSTGKNQSEDENQSAAETARLQRQAGNSSSTVPNANKQDEPFEMDPNELETYKIQADLELQSMGLGGLPVDNNQPSSQGDYEIDQAETAQYTYQAQIEMENMRADPPVTVVDVY